MFTSNENLLLNPFFNQLSLIHKTPINQTQLLSVQRLDIDKFLYL